MSGSVERKSVGSLWIWNNFIELLVASWSSVYEWKEPRGISGRFGGLLLFSFSNAATRSLLVDEKTRSSNSAKATSSCDRYQRYDENFFAVADNIAL